MVAMIQAQRTWSAQSMLKYWADPPAINNVLIRIQQSLDLRLKKLGSIRTKCQFHLIFMVYKQDLFSMETHLDGLTM